MTGYFYEIAVTDLEQVRLDLSRLEKLVGLKGIRPEQRAIYKQRYDTLLKRYESMVANKDEERE